MVSYPTILFDFDGTLVDSGPGIVQTLRLLTEELGLRKLSEEEMHALVGPPINVAFPTVFGVNDPAELEKIIEAYRRIFREVAQPMLRPFPGIPELLRDLRAAGKTTCVATCKTQEVCEEQAEELGLRPYLQYICGARPQEALYEKADIMQAALRESGASKAGAIMVGDRMHDLEGARIVGVPAIGVSYGGGTLEELQAYHPLHIVGSVQELRALLLP